MPLLSLILMTHGWRAMFLVTGMVSLLFFGAFVLFYRDPAGDARLTHAERRHISHRQGAKADGIPASGTLIALLGQAKVWGVTIGFGAYGYAFFLLLTWLPGYLASTFGMSLLTTGLYAAIPWLVAAIVEVLVGGVLVDALIRRGMDATRVRKTVLVIGMLLGVSIFGATTTHDPNIAIAYITIALSGLAVAAPVAWSLPSLIAPRGTVGTVSSIMNFANIVMAFIAPIVAGHIVASTGSFTNVLLTAAAALIAGVLSYVFLLGRIEPIAAGSAPYDAALHT